MKFAQLDGNVIKAVAVFDDAETASRFGFTESLDGVTPEPGTGWSQTAPGVYAPPDAPTPDPVMVLELTVSIEQSAVAVGTPFNVTASFSAPITDSFNVPILDGQGNVAKIKRVDFIAGNAELSISFERSGYYMITEQMLNAELPQTVRVRLLTPIKFAVYE